MIGDGGRRAQDRQASEAPPRQSFSVVQMIVILGVGITAGAAATWMMLIGSLERATPWIDFFLHWVLPVLGAAGAALVLVVPLTWWGVRRLIRRAHGTLDQVAREAISGTREASEGNAPAAASHAERAVLEVLAWYGPIAARRWVVQTSLALLVGFGGLIGTAMLFRQTMLLCEQTELLSKQNDKLDLQTVTAEAQRRAGMAPELFAILQTVSVLEAGATGTGRPILTHGLKSRIVAFSRAATPYRIIEVPERTTNALYRPAEDDGIPVLRIADRARSLERGQLLMGLVLAGVTVSALEGAIFQGADLRIARLPGADLSDVDLSRANLRGANLTNSDLLGTEMRRAGLSNANLSGADLSGADLTNAHMTGANLTRAELNSANLTDADLSGANLTDAKLGFAWVGRTRARGQLPEGFPFGWDKPPPGWELYDDQGSARLRRSGASPSSSAPQ